MRFQFRGARGWHLQLNKFSPVGGDKMTRGCVHSAILPFLLTKNYVEIKITWGVSNLSSPICRGSSSYPLGLQVTAGTTKDHLSPNAGFVNPIKSMLNLGNEQFRFREPFQRSLHGPLYPVETTYLSETFLTLSGRPCRECRNLHCSTREKIDFSPSQPTLLLLPTHSPPQSAAAPTLPWSHPRRSVSGLPHGRAGCSCKPTTDRLRKRPHRPDSGKRAAANYEQISSAGAQAAFPPAGPRATAAACRLRAGAFLPVPRVVSAYAVVAKAWSTASGSRSPWHRRRFRKAVPARCSESGLRSPP